MHRFRTAVEAYDHAAMKSLLAEDVMFFSPVTFRPYVGIEAVSGVLFAIMNTFDEFMYTDELVNGDTTALIFKAAIGDKQIQGMDLLRDNADGKIEQFTDMMRPLSAIIAIGEAMAPKVDDLPRGYRTA